MKRDDVLAGVGASVVAFFLLRKLAKDIGKEADRISKQSMADCGKEIEAMTTRAVIAAGKETDRILDLAGERLLSTTELILSNKRLNCKLHGGSLLCEVEAKEFSRGSSFKTGRFNQ